METPKPTEIQTPKPEPKPIRLSLELLEQRIAPAVTPPFLGRTAGWGC